MGRRRKNRSPIHSRYPHMSNAGVPTQRHRCGKCEQCKAALDKATAKRKVRALKFQT